MIMATEQTVLFTVVPRAISVDSRTMPVSVFVSPRLRGADTLGSFPDWLHWTRKVTQGALALRLECDGREHSVTVPTAGLRPELWDALFCDGTLVRSHVFDDYTDRGIISFSVRQTLSAIKILYQEAGLRLALPDGLPADERDEGNRGVLREMLDGLDVHWNGRNASEWREAVRQMNGSDRLKSVPQAITGPMDREGLIIAERSSTAMKQVAVPFSVFHHMPTPARDAIDMDPSTLLDFHQLLSSLSAYPKLQRALGLVFDVQLPRGFVKQTPANQYKTLSVNSVSFDWEVTTQTPALPTAYVHLAGAQRVFVTAWKSLVESSGAPALVGLLNLDPRNFGLAQVDVDGAMHKTIMLAEAVANPDPARNLDAFARHEPAPEPGIYDPDATLPSLRSGGLSLFADRRGRQLLDALAASKSFNAAIEAQGPMPRPFCAEDLVRGYRLDVWDSDTAVWHSLHLRSGLYRIGEHTFETTGEEGFVQLAATQPAPNAQPETNDLYLHEAIARWAGWSLSAPRPGKHLSRHGDPSRALPPDEEHPDFEEDQPVTPFDMHVKYQVEPGSLPRLKFGTRYRLRARAVDIAGNSLLLSDPITDLLSVSFALTRDAEGLVYLRFEPVDAPLVVIRAEQAVTGPGSSVDRLVIRTFNEDISKDQADADTKAADRHILPPRTSVEMGERSGMFDDANGRLKSDASTWKLIASRDAGELPRATILAAGREDSYPLEPAETIDVLPYLPDGLSRGAAFRDLPGTPARSIGRVAQSATGSGPVSFDLLTDPNPRPGSATLVAFGSAEGWEDLQGFRLALAGVEGSHSDTPPRWDADKRLLTVYLPGGETKSVALSSYLHPDDLKMMGIWQWLREYIERVTVDYASPQYLVPGLDVDRIAHVLQRSVEGGHWMLTPPRLLKLVHAVQQPIGRPRFKALRVAHEKPAWDTNPLSTAKTRGRTDPTELAPLTAWRRPGGTSAYLIGALEVHAPSTAKIDIQAQWEDPIDDLEAATWSMVPRSAHVEELPLHGTLEGYLRAAGTEQRRVGYLDPENSQIAFVRTGDRTGEQNNEGENFMEAAPRHALNDTKRHLVNYQAVASSRYREYFAQNEGLDFTRQGESVLVDIPASARPLAADVAYVLPTFGWQRQSDTNLKRSVRFGGGLRVYLRRPWFSSGEGELLGVALWSHRNGPLTDANRERYKAYITQWGMDPIWQTAGLQGVPSMAHFSGASASDEGVSLEEGTVRGANGEPGRIDVIGFPVEFDEERGLWFADLTLNTPLPTYAPFVRLALVRYQPRALANVHVSRVVLADFAQLTPDRSAVVTSDPHHPNTLRVVVSGVAPRGPMGSRGGDGAIARPTEITVRVQVKNDALPADLGWVEAGHNVATVEPVHDGAADGQPDLALWSGTVRFGSIPEAGRYRLIIREFEHVASDAAPTQTRGLAPLGRLIYAETFEIDDVMLGGRIAT
jgi:hypothetical protein